MAYTLCVFAADVQGKPAKVVACAVVGSRVKCRAAIE